MNTKRITAAHLSPFYMREHSKRLLRGALYNDSKFLADINVMDYSLVVGVDSVGSELVVGIVGMCILAIEEQELDCYIQIMFEHIHGTRGSRAGSRKLLLSALERVNPP